MLPHIYEHIAAILAPVQQATLATYGPAGLLANVLPCVAEGMRLFLLLPLTSDHLLNLEHSPTVAVATDDWHVRARARVLSSAQSALLPYFAAAPEKPWSVVLQVELVRLHRMQRDGWGAAETFDLGDTNSPTFDR